MLLLQKLDRQAHGELNDAARGRGSDTGPYPVNQAARDRWGKGKVSPRLHSYFSVADRTTWVRGGDIFLLLLTLLTTTSSARQLFLNVMILY